jgi:cytochrome c peroxidase
MSSRIRWGAWALVGVGVALAGGRAGAEGQAGSAPAAAAAPAAQVVKSGSWTMTLPLGLQADAAYIPDDNPMSDAKIKLGKFLYFDARLSKDRSISCASCHSPYHGFADPARTSEGVGFQHGTRNSPTVMNRLFSSDQFWDGRAADLEAQAHGPLTNPVEMAMGSNDEVVARVKAVPGYAPLFAQAFGDTQIDMPRIAKAIAAYERTVVTGDSPYDRFLAGDKSAMSESATRGLAVFMGKGRCVTCHVGFNFSDENYRNIGVGMTAPKPDLGRYEVTKKEADKGAFKTPTLRNIVLTAPYMHDGSEATLVEVVEYYDRGGNKNPWLSSDIMPLHLTAQEKLDLVAFLEALSGPVTNAAPPASLPQ